jgi:hypothetical protein
MTSIAYNVVHCDDPDCDEESPMEPTKREARKTAHLVGYRRLYVVHYGRRLDFCPEHYPQWRRSELGG